MIVHELISLAAKRDWTHDAGQHTPKLSILATQNVANRKKWEGKKLTTQRGKCTGI